MVTAAAGQRLAGARLEPPFYYHHGTETISLELADYVAIRWRASDRSAVRSRFPQLLGSEGRQLPVEGLSLEHLATTLTESQKLFLFEELAHQPEIDRVTPVFGASEMLMIPTDEVLVRFAAENSDEIAQRLCWRLDLQDCRRVPWSPSTYRLTTQPGRALEVANRLQSRPDVVWSQPDFLRVLVRPQLSPVAAHPGDEPDSPASRVPGPSPVKGSSRFPVIHTVAFRSPPGFDPGDSTRDVPAVDRSNLVSESFENPIPDHWLLTGDPTWATTTDRPYSGSGSGYCVGSAEAPPGPYPNGADAWMIFGPFGLQGVEAARVDLQAWIQTESYYDYFKVAVSIDGIEWYGLGFSGDWGGWRNIALDLEEIPTLGSVLGRPQVWLALSFESDVSITYEGVYVDDIVLETIAGGYQDLTSDDFDHLQWNLQNNEQLWGISGADINAVQAWDITTGSDTVVIAVIDSGLDIDHPDLGPKMVPGYDATGGGTDGAATGDDAHGTACAALAAAVTDNGIGVAGVAREARLMPVRIFVGGVTRDSWAADGIHWAVEQGADILNNSWGGGLPSAAIDEALEFAIAAGRQGLGTTTIFAAGNSNQDRVSYPANLVHTLAVGALSPCDERKSHTSCDGEFWWGSNYGTELDLLAPGVLLRSADLTGAAGYAPGDYLSDFNGTSAAAPVVAGVAALMLALSPDLTREEVEDLLRGSARDLLAEGWDPETGHGTVDAGKALLALQTAVTDLEAIEVSLRDAPAGGGSVVDDPLPGQQVYLHLHFAVNTLQPVAVRIASLTLDGELLCDLNGPIENGDHLLWCNDPWSAIPGSHELEARVDPDEVIAEADETNNRIVFAFTTAGGDSEIFADGFESGDLSNWSSTIP